MKVEQMVQDIITNLVGNFKREDKTHDFDTIKSKIEESIKGQLSNEVK